MRLYKHANNYSKSLSIILHIDLLDYSYARNTVLVVVAQTPDPLPSDNGIETLPIQCDLSNVVDIGYYQVGGAGYRGHLCDNIENQLPCMRIHHNYYTYTVSVLYRIAGHFSRN